MDRQKNGKILVFSKYVIRNGKRIYPKNGKVFRFWVNKDRDSAA